MLASSRDERRACALRVGGEQRWIAADDAGLYRDALGVVPPGGLPDGVPRRRRPTRCASSSRRYARTHGPFTTAELRARYGVDPTARRCSELERDGDARARRAAARRQRRARVVRPRGPAPAAPRLARRRCARRSSRPTSARWPRSCRRGRASTATRRRAPGSTGCARCSCRCRASRCPPRCGSATCCRAAPAPTRRRGWTSSARRGEVVWVGAGRARAQLAAASRCTSARTPRRSGRRAARASVDARRPSPSTTCSASGCAPSPCFFTDLLAEVDARARGAPGGAVGPRLGGRGDQRRVGAAARAAPDARPRAARAPSAAAAARAASARARGGAQPHGAGPLVADRRRSSAREPRPAPAARARSPSCCSSATASSPASRSSPRASPAASRSLYDALAAARDARRLPARLLRRGPRRRAVRAARRGRAAARAARRRGGAAARARRDRPGAALRRRAAVAQARRDERAPAPGARRAAPTSCSSAPSRSLYVERGGRGLADARRAATTRGCAPRFEALAAFVTGGRGRKLVARARRRRAGRRLARSSRCSIELGFRAGPRKLTLSA